MSASALATVSSFRNRTCGKGLDPSEEGEALPKNALSQNESGKGALIRGVHSQLTRKASGMAFATQGYRALSAAPLYATPVEGWKAGNGRITVVPGKGTDYGSAGTPGRSAGSSERRFNSWDFRASGSVSGLWRPAERIGSDAD